ncbi:MAG: hypothetical protein HWD92_02270 [Flavobacteriia bacterium]|nr:hypothetical protein [Flavobacteriia bacterium]
MKYLLIAITSLFSLSPFAQSIDSLDGKWALTGSRSLLFSVEDSVLYMSLVDSDHEERFSSMMSGRPNYKIIERAECEVDAFNNYIYIGATFTYWRTRTFRLIYNYQRPNHISIFGDIYDPKEWSVPNQNCDTDVPHCEVILRDVEEWSDITQLPRVTSMPREEVISLMNRIIESMDTVCNSCQEGVHGANWNSVIIDLGYNPVIKEDNGFGYNSFGLDEVWKKYRDEEDAELLELMQSMLERFHNLGTQLDE